MNDRFQRRSGPYPIQRRRYPLLMAVFMFCFILAVDTIRQDLLGGTPAGLDIKYGLAVLMTVSAFIGASVGVRRIEKSAKSNQEAELTR